MRKSKVLIIILLFSFIVNILVSYQVLSHSQVARVYDENTRLENGFELYESLFLELDENIFERVNEFICLSNFQAHPRLYEFIEALAWRAMHIFKLSDEGIMILIVNMFFLLILLLSTYGIGSAIYSNEVGFFSALFVSMLPMVFAHSRIAMLDFPLTCMVSLSLYLLIKTQRFSSLLYSTFFGISMGLSQLTKESAVLFILPPLVYYLAGSYRSNNKKVALNSSIAASIFIAITAVVYLQKCNLHAYGIYFGKIFIKTPFPRLYYFREFYKIPGLLIFFISLPFLLTYFLNFRKREKFLLFWFLAPIILLSLSSNKSLRFILPVAPAFILIITQEIFLNKLFKALKQLLVVLFILVLMIQYSLYNTGLISSLGRRSNISLLEQGILSIEKSKYSNAVLTLFEFFRNEPVDVDLEEEKEVLFLFNIGEIHCPLSRKLLYAGLPFVVSCPLEADEVDTKNIKWGKVQEDILLADYVLNREERGGYLPHSPGAGANSVLMEGFNKYKDKFYLMAEVNLFDDSRIYVYKKL